MAAGLTAPELRELSADERSEEHTSELQSRQYLVCRLLLEKKKINYDIFLKHYYTLTVHNILCASFCLHPPITCRLLCLLSYFIYHNLTTLHHRSRRSHCLP